MSDTPPALSSSDETHDAPPQPPAPAPSRLKAAGQRLGTLARSRLMRRGLVATVLFLLVVGVLGFLVAPDLLRTQIEQRAGAALARKVQIGQVHLNPYTLRLQLDGVHIADADGQSPFVDIDRATTRVSWASLFRLAPVVGELRLDRPRVRIVRTGPQRFNFSDIVDRLMAQPASPSASPTRFAVSNIELRDGDIQFDDRVLQARHHVAHLELGVPFLANLPSDVDVFVRPLLSMQVDGSPLRFEGQAKPFARSLDSTLHFRLDRLDLARYVDYVPVRLPVALPRGWLSGDVALRFLQASTPQLGLTGQLQLDDLALQDTHAAPLATIGRARAQLTDVQPLIARYHLGAISLERSQLHFVGHAGGGSNFSTLAASPAAAASATSAPAPKSAAPATDLRVATLTLRDNALHYTDATGHTLSLDGLQGALQHLALSASAPPAALNLSGHVAGGTISSTGTLDLAHARLDTTLGLSHLDLPTLLPLAQGALPVQVPRGTLDAAGQLQLGWATGLTLHLSKTRTTLSDTALQPAGTRGGTPPVAWQKLDTVIDEVDLTQRVARVQSVLATGLALDVQRARDGQLNLARLAAAPAAGSSRAAQTRSRPGTASAPWQWSVAHAGIDQSTVRWTDAATGSRPVHLTVEALKGGIDALDSHLDRPRALTLAGRIGAGSFALAGKAQPTPVWADLHVTTRAMDLAPFQPYVQVPLNVTITSAHASNQGQLVYDGRRSGHPTFSYQGNAALEQVRIRDKLTGDDFLRWRTLAGTHLRVTAGSGRPRIDVGHVLLSAFYARMIINANGRLNLSDVVAQPQSAPVSVTRVQPTAGAAPSRTPAPAPVTAPSAPLRTAVAASAGTVATAPTAAASEPAAPLPVDMRIGGITLANGQLNYTDNYIRPHYTANMTRLAGRIGAFGTAPGAPPASVAVHAALNGRSPIDITGSVNPLQPVAFLDIKGKADRVELPSLSTYSTRYTGYPITHGRLSVDVHYRLDHRQLNADNHILLTELTFGNRDESPGIRHLPVKLAVALLKDDNGNIDVNLPVTGSLDDPQFSMGGLIWRAVGNLIVKVVTAPFKLLGAIFGGSDPGALGYVEFAPGSAVLDTDAQDKLAKVVTLLQKKSALQLGLVGRVDPARDADGLRHAMAQTLIRREKALDTQGKKADLSDTALASITITPDEYETYLKRAYKHAPVKNRPRNFLGLDKSLDPEAMRKLLDASIPVDDKALKTLAEHRAQAVRTWLHGKLDDQRITLRPVKLSAAGIEDKGKTTRADLALGVDGETGD